MKIPFVFQRRKGAGALPLLGSDATAVTANTPPQQSQGNAVFTRSTSNGGWPVHRVAVTYACTATSVDLNARMYAFDHATQQYYLLGAQVALKQNQVNFFDCLPVLDQAPSAASAAGLQPAALELVLVVDDAGVTAVDGTYTFGMAPLLAAQA